MFRKALCKRSLKFISVLCFVYFVILNWDSKTIYEDSEQNGNKLAKNQEEFVEQNERNSEV